MGMVWFVLRSAEADRHKMDSCYHDGFIAPLLVVIAIGFNQGRMLFLFILRSVKANSDEMDGGCCDCFIAPCLIFIAVGFNQGRT